MKKVLSTFVLILLCGSLAMAEQSDEERLDTLIDSGWDKKAQYQEDHKEKQEKKPAPTETKTVTTITVTTQVTTIQEPAPDYYRPNSGRIGIGTLALAEFLGAITPGLGMAHFTVGDTRGGLITLGMTGLSLALYLSAEIMIETRTIDNPNIYGIMYYGSFAVYGAAILYDLLGTPVYVRKYNQNLTAQIRPMKAVAVQYEQLKPRFGFNLIDVEIRF